ncbi:MAG: acetyltransferase [Bacteroidia bacterium]
MLESKSIYIFGYSGHAYVVIESILDLGFTIKGYFDIQKVHHNPYNLKYMGSEKSVDVKQIVGSDFVFPCVGDNTLRNQMLQLFKEKGLNQCTIIDPTANVSPSAQIGVSSYVGKGSIINAQAQIGDACIINSGAIIEHECGVSSACHIAPGAILCGNVQVGNKTLIGSRSVIRPNLSICGDVTLGAGSVLVKSIENEGTWVGNPAREIK